MLEVKNLRKVYDTKRGGIKTEALKNISFEINKGEFLAIMGESGSGKSTLLNLIATLDKPTNGDILLNGKSMLEIRDRDIATFRRERLGFVFQDFSLLENFSNKDNILLPLVLSGMKIDEMKRRIIEVAKILQIEDILDKYPFEISGGQQQRISIARAVITKPDILLADEPTGALDSKASDNTMRLFSNLNKNGQTIMMVTHSIRAASNADRVLFIKDGIVYHEIYRGIDENLKFAEKISDSLVVLSKEADYEE